MGKPNAAKGKGKGQKGGKYGPPLRSGISSLPLGQKQQDNAQWRVFDVNSNKPGFVPPRRVEMKTKTISLVPQQGREKKILFTNTKGKGGERERSRSVKRGEKKAVILEQRSTAQPPPVKEKMKFSLSDVRHPGESDQAMERRLQARKAKYGPNTPTGGAQKTPAQSSVPIIGVPSGKTSKAINLTTNGKSPFKHGKKGNNDGATSSTPKTVKKLQTEGKGGVKFRAVDLQSNKKKDGPKSKHQDAFDKTKETYVDIFKGKLFNKHYDKKTPLPSTVLLIVPAERDTIAEAL